MDNNDAQGITIGLSVGLSGLILLILLLLYVIHLRHPSPSSLLSSVAPPPPVAPARPLPPLPQQQPPQPRPAYPAPADPLPPPSRRSPPASAKFSSSAFPESARSVRAPLAPALQGERHWAGLHAAEPPQLQEVVGALPALPSFTRNPISLHAQPRAEEQVWLPYRAAAAAPLCCPPPQGPAGP